MDVGQTVLAEKGYQLAQCLLVYESTVLVGVSDGTQRSLG